MYGWTLKITLGIYLLIYYYLFIYLFIYLWDATLSISKYIALSGKVICEQLI